MKPDLRKVMRTDDRFGGTLELAVMLLVVIALLVAYILRYGQQPYDGIYLQVACVLLVLSCITMALRWAYIAKVLRFGVAVPGVVTKVDFSQRRGYIAFTFELAGKAYSVHNAVLRKGAVGRLTTGDAVTVLVLQQEPQYALIAELYSSDEDVERMQ